MQKVNKNYTPQIQICCDLPTHLSSYHSTTFNQWSPVLVTTGQPVVNQWFDQWFSGSSAQPVLQPVVPVVNQWPTNGSSGQWSTSGSSV
jgi:hypothetical protein